MKAVENLPEGYVKIYEVNLEKDKKTALLVNVLAAVIAALMTVSMHFVVPFSLFDMENGMGAYAIRLGVVLVLTIAYVLLHEFIHGIAMKLCGTQKVKYGFTGMYAFAGSEDYYDKKSYIFIALAPIVFWGIVLGIVNFIVPIEWFWIVYLIQIFNLSGAAGDLFVTVKFSRLPKDILVKDYGVGMTVFSRENADFHNAAHT